jgi:hypothetical protein
MGYRGIIVRLSFLRDIAMHRPKSDSLIGVLRNVVKYFIKDDESRFLRDALARCPKYDSLTETSA